MQILLVKLRSSQVSAAISALAPIVAPQDIDLYGSLPLPEPSTDDKLEELAKKVVLAVRPKPTQPMRREALQKLLKGHDTFMDQGGVSDPALRNAMGAISKALRSVFGHDQAIRRLAVPRKTFMADKSYQGTIYDVTPLGRRVRELLITDGSI